MRSILIQLALSFNIAAAVSALPSENAFGEESLVRRAVTPDNTCGITGGGAGKGYTCDPKLPQGGSCCSINGYCGKTDQTLSPTPHPMGMRGPPSLLTDSFRKLRHLLWARMPKPIWHLWETVWHARHARHAQRLIRSRFDLHQPVETEFSAVE